MFAAQDIETSPLDSDVVALIDDARPGTTDDGGATWTPAAPPGFVGACPSIGVDPLDGARVLACQAAPRLFI